LSRIKKQFPPGPAIENYEAFLELGRRDFTAAETRLRGMIPRYQSNRAAYDRFLNLFAGVLAVRGKMAEANRTFERLAELRRGSGSPAPLLNAQLRRVIADASYGSDHRVAKAQLDESLRASSLEQLPERERPVMIAIRASVAVGDRERAGRLLDQIDRNLGSAPRRYGKYIRQLARGFVLSMRDEALHQAIAAFTKAEPFCGFCAQAPMARAFDRLGLPDSALVYYTKWVEGGEESWDGGPYYLEQANAYFRLGELYEAKGDKTKAIDFYGRFTELWRDADPEFQPRVKEARRRIAELLKARG
ncbi:MAG: tetratricopeptide repeat protein, partial [Gemmatimonadota bacterium]